MRLPILVFLISLVGCEVKNAAIESSADAPDTVNNNLSDYEDSKNGCVSYKSRSLPEETLPFNMSDKIELVAYQTREDSFSNDKLIEDGKFIVPAIEQRVNLDKIQRDSLFSILFNHKKLDQFGEEAVADCYWPRHSIVFYQNGYAIAFLEICFECGGRRQTHGVDFGDFCDEKLCMLENFFKANKVDYEIEFCN